MTKTSSLTAILATIAVLAAGTSAQAAGKNPLGAYAQVPASVCRVSPSGRHYHGYQECMSTNSHGSWRPSEVGSMCSRLCGALP
jgi:hypothetical protein